MNSNLTQEQIKEFYLEVCRGNRDAFEYLYLWSRYTHKFDDLVDEEFSIEKLIETNNELTELLTCAFFKEYGKILLPFIYLSAEAYQASETSQCQTALGGFLSHEGNNMLRVVSLICGDYKHLVEISEEIRRLTYVEHPDEFQVPLINNN